MTGDAAPEPVGQDARGASRSKAEPHEHSWARMEFELVDDHPVVRQRCEACGFVRRYRAWERYWVPDAARELDPDRR
jgi:hypothetical protein